MSDDETFRRVLLFAVAILLPVGIYHRWKAATSEKLDRLQEGLVLLISIRLLALIGVLGVVAFLINPEWMAWSSLPLPTWLRWAGVGLWALVAIFAVWTFRNLGKNLTDTVVTRKEHNLVTNGPYRWVRHPFYICVFLGLLAVSLMTANWYVFAAGALVSALLVLRTKKEEDKLVERFGDDYRRYMATTGRFWPRFRRV